MKKMLICVVAVAIALTAAAAQAKGLPEEAAAADAIVWAGLDYSQVKMFGTQDFKDPGAIFPGFLEKWNELFIKEIVPKLGNQFGKSVVVDIDGVTAANRKAKPSQVVQKDGGKELLEASDITPQDIAAAVKAYKMANKTGVGLVLIVDRFVKAEEAGCVYAVFFDVASRKVLSSTRGCYKAAGFGFRNYWFRPIKSAIDDLK